jgi:hypothetical protein
MHIANGTKAGIVTGSYYYNWGALGVSDQVDSYIAMEGNVGLHVIDWEGVEGFTAGQAAEFIKLYKARTGNLIGLYASEGRFRDLGQDWNWIANYSQGPQKEYTIWQYGPFRGADGDQFAGTRADLLTLANKGAPADVSIATRGLTLTSDYSLDLPAGTGIVDAPGGQLIGHFTGTFDYFGTDGALKAVRVPTDAGSVIGFTSTAATPYKKPVVVVPDPTPFTQADLDAAVSQIKPVADEAIAFKDALRKFLGT